MEGTRARGGGRLCSPRHPLTRGAVRRGRGGTAAGGGKLRTGAAIHPGRAHTRRRTRSASGTRTGEATIGAAAAVPDALSGVALTVDFAAGYPFPPGLTAAPLLVVAAIGLKEGLTQ